MRPAVTVVDYGRGNLFSLGCALGAVGADPLVTDDPRRVLAAEALVLPGVGAFGDAMAALAARGLVEPLAAAAARGTPLLGICLGMQVLATVGEEFGRRDGLGLVPGTVRRLPEARPGDAAAVRIPNVGWRSLDSRRADPLLAGLGARPMMYFVHSYALFPDRADEVVATIPVNGVDAPAIVRRGAVVGCQFHPEKSGAHGLRLLANFLARVPVDAHE